MNRDNNETNRYELNQMADEFLREHGLGIWGESRNQEAYRQSRFEHSMPTGAYRRNSERRRS